MNIKKLSIYCNLIDHKIFLLIQLFIFKLWGFVFNTNYHRFKFFLPTSLKTGEKLKYMFELFIQRDPDKKEFYKIFDDLKYICLLDLGANIGTVSHYFLNLHPARWAYLVEPQMKCNNFLLKTASPRRSEIIRCGAGREKLRNLLYKKTEMDVNASLWENPEKHHGCILKKTKKYELIFTHPIDDLHLERKVDLIKINIEGGEPGAIMGMLKLIERDKPDILFDPHNDSNLGDIRAFLDMYTIKKIDKTNYLAEPMKNV